MENIVRGISRFRYKIWLVGLLVAASLVSLVLQRVHAVISGGHGYTFLPVNLRLAWIPFLAAILANASTRWRRLFYFAMPVSTLVWLIFFPNAPYLLTDFQHLSDVGGYSPLWFNVIVLVWFAWTGLLLGIASLYLMQEIISRRLGTAAGWIFVVGATILSSIGVFLGRFLRWNSWDLLQDPLMIAQDMYGIVRHPISNLPTYGFTILFTLLILFIYVTIYLFGGMLRERTTREGQKQL